MTLSAVALCNLALAEIPSTRITSMDENTQNAAACREQFTQVLGEVMESGEWSFAVERQALVEIANTRTDRWAYAYAAPNNMAQALAIHPAPPTVTYPELLAGQRWASTQTMGFPPIDFDYEGPTIWTNERNAVIEFIQSDPEYARFSFRFNRLLAVSLAARIVLSITKDPKRKQELLSEAELLRQRGVAADLNRNPTQQTYGDNFIPSTLMGHVEAPE